MGVDEKIAHIQARMDRAPNGSNGGARQIILRPIHEIVAERREPEWLIDDIIERRVLAVLAGPRGTFKSFIALDWSMRMALDGHTGVILSGEGQGLGNRVAAWMNQHREDVDLSTLPLMAHELPINLNSLLELESLRLACSELIATPKFIVIDTFSKFSAGIDENSNGEVAAFLSGLSMLRDEFGSTILLVAHSGHGDAKRPRGANALMSNPDCEYIVERNGMTVTVTRDRFKDTPSLLPLVYEAKVIDLGRMDSRGRPVTSVALVSSDLAPPTALKGRGKNQERALIALNEWARTNPTAAHITSIAITEIFKAQKIYPKRRKEVLDYLTNIRVLTPSIGGFTVDQAML